MTERTSEITEIKAMGFDLETQVGVAIRFADGRCTVGKARIRDYGSRDCAAAAAAVKAYVAALA